MEIDQSGFLKGVRFIPSPNFDERPPEETVTLLVIHNISLPPREYGGNGVIEFFTNRLDPSAHEYYRMVADLKVSAHFFIRRDGEIIQFVNCNLRAWHAGLSAWKGRERCNDFSIGIELEGSDLEAFEDVQYEKLAELTRALKKAYPIEDIAGHSHIASNRKTDPGPFFQWERYLAAAGQGAGPDVS
ncbi:MAG: 1,6-anhydro-N-acetylmuramyl-L-alanine amidase AmpD [Sulfuricella sp.]|nr:1,6-anhydro-N-acetylmuramyl-L-alanine amidase AmpD [Sulfuricella sp.]